MLDIEGVDGGLSTIGIPLDFQFAFELLVFFAIPMEADTDSYVLQQEGLFPPLVSYLRGGQYAYAYLHINY